MNNPTAPHDSLLHFWANWTFYINDVFGLRTNHFSLPTICSLLYCCVEFTVYFSRLCLPFQE